MTHAVADAATTEPTGGFSPGHLLFLLAIAALGFFSQIWAGPLFDLDEGAFGEAAREMVTGGDYITPHLNGAVRYDKPILIYWLQSASVRTFGMHAWALRLPSAICALLWMFAVYRFTRRHVPLDPGAATLAAAGIALSLMASIIGHAATADAVLNLLLTVALLDLYRFFLSPSRARALRCYLWIGLGLLAKGPIALALPAAVGLLHAVDRGKFRQWVGLALNPFGWLLLCAVVLPWAVLSYRADGGDFLRHFLLDHNLGRYTETMEGHGGRAWYYLLWLPVVVLPFTAALVPTIAAAVRRRDSLDRFLLIWFLVVFIVFSFSATQLPHYMLYGATPLFILCGRWREMLPPRVLTLLPALLLTAAIVALPWVLPKIPIKPDRLFERGVVELASASFTLSYSIVAFAACAMVLLLMFLPGLSRMHALIGAAIAQTCAIWFAVAPVLEVALQQPVVEAAQRGRELNLPATSYKTHMPSFSFYSGEIVPEGVPQPGQLVFVRLDRIADLQKDLLGVALIPEFRKGGVTLQRRPLDTPPAPTDAAAHPPAAGDGGTPNP